MTWLLGGDRECLWNIKVKFRDKVKLHACKIGKYFGGVAVSNLHGKYMYEYKIS